MTVVYYLTQRVFFTKCSVYSNSFVRWPMSAFTFTCQCFYSLIYLFVQKCFCEHSVFHFYATTFRTFASLHFSVKYFRECFRRYCA